MSQVVDSQAREQALNTERSYITQAPAGSGKTQLLTQRTLKLLGCVEEPENIMAITFTRKAASEMRGRVLSALKMAQDPKCPEAEPDKTTYLLAKKVLARSQEMGWELELNPGRLQILTIDSLCAAIAKKYPITNTFGVLPTVTESPQLLYRKAAKLTLNELENSDERELQSALIRVLSHVDNNLPRLETLLANILSKRQQWLEFVVPLAKTDSAREYLESVLSNQINQVLEIVSDLIGPDGQHELVDHLQLLDKHRSLMQEDSLYPCYSEVEMYTSIANFLLTTQNKFRKNYTKTSGVYAPSSAPSHLKDDFAAAKERSLELLNKYSSSEALCSALARVRGLPSETYTEVQWDLIQALLTLLMHAASQLKLVFAENSESDFAEISELALSALGSDDAPSDMALSLDYKIQHILVDEFQDTSINQFKLLQKLTAGWECDDGRTLFLVGDPMQSIYRFREAEVANFVVARQHGVGQIRLDPLYLVQNFRSNESLVNGFNELFSSVFSDVESLPSGEVAFAEAKSFFEDTDNTQITADAVIASNDRSEETKLVIEKVKSSLKDLDEPSIAILARSRSHLSSIAAGLSKAGIPFNSVEIQKMANRPLVNDVLEMAKAITRLGDTQAWVSLLRQPVIGLPLADIHRLLNEAEEQDMLLSSYLLNWMPSDDQCDGKGERLLKTMPILSRAIEDLRGYGLSLVLSTAVSALGYVSMDCYTGAEDDMNSVLDFIEDITESNGLPVYEQITEKLSSLHSSQTGGPEAKVHLMTIHKSKGLQFDTVIIPGMDRKSGKNDAQLLQWNCVYEHDSFEPAFLLAPLRAAEQSADPTYQFVTQTDSAFALQELKRLCYVALTRARQRLHMIYHLAPKGEGYSTPSDSTLAGIGWAYLEKIQKLHELSEDVSEVSEKVARKVPQSKLSDLSPNESSRLKRPNYLEDPGAGKANLTNLMAKAFGTALHLELEVIAEMGVEKFTSEAIQARRGYYRSLLIESGAFISEVELQAATNKFVELVDSNVNNSSYGWVFDSSGNISYSEYEIQERLKGYVATHRIDRLVDRGDHIALVDYKSDQPLSEEGAEEFIERSRKEHRGQLERYSRLVTHLGKPVKPYLLLLSVKELVEV